jgi:hypothetical protein
MKLVAHNNGVYMIECEKTFLEKVAGESDDTGFTLINLMSPILDASILSAYFISNRLWR